MRVSTNQLFDRNIRSIMDNQREISNTQNSLSTGKRLNTPSDDPVGAAKLVRLTEEMDKLTQYQRNNDLFVSSLEQQEAVFDNINNTALRARTLLLRAGSGALNDSDRKAIGTELAQIRDEMLGLMNTQDANGDYIFSGHQSQHPAFSFNPGASGNAVTFTGDAGENKVKLSDGVTVRSSVSGQHVFENVLARRDFSLTTPATATVEKAVISSQNAFDSFSEAYYDPVNSANNNFQLEILVGDKVQLTNSVSGVVETVDFTPGEPFSVKGMEFELQGAPGDTLNFELNTPKKKNIAETLHEVSSILMQPTVATDIDSALNDALVGLDNSMEKVALERSSIGGRINIARSIFETNLDLEIAAKEVRSSIEDTDYAKASADFAKQEAALNAAMATFPKLANMSLFDYIR